MIGDHMEQMSMDEYLYSKTQDDFNWDCFNIKRKEYPDEYVFDSIYLYIRLVGHISTYQNLLKALNINFKDKDGNFVYPKWAYDEIIKIYDYYLENRYQVNDLLENSNYEPIKQDSICQLIDKKYRIDPYVDNQIYYY